MVLVKEQNEAAATLGPVLLIVVIVYLMLWAFKNNKLPGLRTRGVMIPTLPGPATPTAPPAP